VVRVLVAPDKFKGTLDARDVVSAIGRGLRGSIPGVEVVERPMGDGGEGTASVLVEAFGGSREEFDVDGPMGETVRAPLFRLADGRAIVEMADASGLRLVPESRRDALAASSRGTGQLISHALDPGASVLVALGGSASTDGGTGAAAATGWRFLDARGMSLPPGGGSLERLARIVPPDGPRRSGAITGLCDVNNELLGPGGAARSFARQKGADDAQVAQLERGLEVLSERIRLDLGITVDTEPGAGAAGGMGAGLLAFFKARLLPGFGFLADACGLARAITDADLVITGEGTLDEGSLGGKTPVAVARMARAAGTPCLALCGAIDLPDEVLSSTGFVEWMSLDAEVGHRRALGDPSGSLASAVPELVKRHLSG
jgi:glycerate kinase